MKEEERSAFEAAGAEKELSLFREFVAMMRDNKTWWLAPDFLILLFFGLLIILGASGAVPFIHTLF